MIQSAIQSEGSFNIIHLETFIKLDVFVLRATAFDQQIMQRASEGVLAPESPEPLPVMYSSPEDIVLHKLYWYRLGGEQSERQWRDLIGVMKVQQGSLDERYMMQWSKQIGVDDLLIRAFDEVKL